MVVSIDEEVVWHDLECGGYRADLPLWRELASQSLGRGEEGRRVLDIGAGTGRVTLDLARAGHAVSALDLAPALIAELDRRAGGLPLRAVVADGRDFQLEDREHRLCLVPMQTIQLLRGSAERRALFACARSHLRPGSLLACAIVSRVDEFDVTAADVGPAPERVHLGDALYVSRAVRVNVGTRFIRIERERFVAEDAGAEPGGEVPGLQSRGPALQRNVIELERVTVADLHADGRAAGLAPEPTRMIAETDEHTASEVVMFRA